MVEVTKYYLPPTALIPNSPQPLLYYPKLLFTNPSESPLSVYDTFSSNGWQAQWIFRYGPTQDSHYHSAAHECMAVLSGSARIRFGVADTTSDLEDSTHGSGKEADGVEIDASRGDVFVLPAGTAHKTFDTRPDAEFKLLTPGAGKDVRPEDMRHALAEIELDGFTMLGAYPRGGSSWDFATGGEHVGKYEEVWSVQKPENDPVLGKAVEGLCGQWE